MDRAAIKPGIQLIRITRPNCLDLGSTPQVQALNPVSVNNLGITKPNIHLGVALTWWGDVGRNGVLWFKSHLFS